MKTYLDEGLLRALPGSIFSDEEILLDLTVPMFPGYITVGGHTYPAYSHGYIALPTEGIRYVTMSPGGDTLGRDLNYVYHVDDSGNVTIVIPGNITTETTYHFMNETHGTLYINCFSGDYAKTCKLTFYPKLSDRNITVAIEELESSCFDKTQSFHLWNATFVQNGYVDTAGTFQPNASGKHWIVSLDASNISSIGVQCNEALVTSQLAVACIKDSQGTVISVFVDHDTEYHEYTIPQGVGYTLYVSYYSHATSPAQYYDTINIKYRGSTSDIVESSLYCTALNRPYSFSNKLLQFFGDSITYGYIAASGDVPAHQAVHNYPKVFSNLVGATYQNLAVSGSTISPVSGYPAILSALQSATLTSDMLFIAGGINDWQLGVGAGSLRQAMDSLCGYLGSNYNGEVIFITPIDEAGRTPTRTPAQTLQSVRNVITEVALSHEYAVVQGSDLNFPTIQSSPDYITTMFQDRLHPTEFGYKSFAYRLKSLLL